MSKNSCLFNFKANARSKIISYTSQTQDNKQGFYCCNLGLELATKGKAHERGACCNLKKKTMSERF